MPRSEAQRLQDMRDAYERIASFLVGLDVEAFRADQRTVRAVLYNLVVLGEAAKGVGPETRARFRPDAAPPTPRTATRRNATGSTRTGQSRR